MTWQYQLFEGNVKFSALSGFLCYRSNLIRLFVLVAVRVQVKPVQTNL